MSPEVSAGEGYVPFEASEIHGTIHGRFARMVDAYPDRPAVVGRETALTYAQLDAQAGRVAERLRSLGGVESSPVAVWAPQGVDATVSILGVLKAGAFYVPFDEAVDRSWLSDLLPRLGSPIVITREDLLGEARSLAAGQMEVFDIAELRATGPNARATDETSDVRSQSPHGHSEAGHPVGSPGSESNLAYVFFTSGTTGSPKGVMDSHRNVLHNVMRYTNALKIGRGDRLTLLQSIGFSGSVSSLFCALLNGACVCPLDVRRETAATIADWITQQRITMYHSVPSLFRSITSAGTTFPSVRVVRLEGDQASMRDFDRFREHFARGSALVNGLGTTETGIVCQYVMDHDSPVPEEVLPVGYASEDMTVEVVGEDGAPVTPGRIGEIAVASRYLATGYRDDPERTSQAFVSTDDDDGGRVYRTGDLGRIGPDGALQVLGRADGRLRLRGDWVEPARIEEALVRLAGVREAAVTVFGGDLGERLVAYVVADEEVQSPLRMRRSLIGLLPGLMIPSRIERVDRLPLTANGKLDRGALPAPRRERPDLGTPYRPPSSTLESLLVERWGELLQTDDIGVGDDFFELGGDSLMALTMLGRLEQDVGRRVGADVLLAGATIEHLARALRSSTDWLRVPIVALREGGSGAPFFFLHGDYLTSGLYTAELVRQIDADRPVYAMSPSGVGGDPRLPTYQAMAAWHVDVMKSVHPHGPYVLGGTCNGGLVAYEMARLLRDQGEEVAIVIMIDATAVNVRFRSLATFVSALRRLGMSERRTERLYRAARRNVLRIDSLGFVGALSRAARRVGARPGAASQADSGRVAESVDDPDTAAEARLPGEGGGGLRAHYRRLDELYMPGRYQGDAVLLWPAESSEGRLASQEEWWRRLCPNVEVREIPGNGLTCLTRHVADLAREIRDVLEKVD